MTAFDLVERDGRDQLGEAPFWDEAEQALFWVDIVGKCVHRLNPASGDLKVWNVPRHCSAVIPTGRGDAVVALTDGLHRLDLASGSTRLFARPDQDLGNRSNECRADPDGRLWLGTMCNNLGPQGEPLEITRSSGGVFCVTADGAAKQMVHDVGIANVLCWSPDGTLFYAADSKLAVIWVFDYLAEGPVLSNRRVFVGGGPGFPDGSSIDEEGCLWTARWGGGRVIRYTPAGDVDLEIELPVRQPSNCAFGGADRKTLYITSARQELEDLAPDSLDGSVFVVRVGTAGMPMTRFKG